MSNIMEEGKLVPMVWILALFLVRSWYLTDFQDVVFDLLKQAMLKEISSGSKGFVIDGYPRDLKQGRDFESEVGFYF